MISNNNIIDISYEENSINEDNTELHSEEYFLIKENLFGLDKNFIEKAVEKAFLPIKSSCDEMPLGIEEKKNIEIFKVKVIKMIKKKRGRPTNNSINKKVHTSGDFDNLLRKIQVNFLNFVTSIINEIIYSFLGNKLLCLCKFNSDQKRDVKSENVETFKNYSIKDLILKIKSSPKYTTMRLNKNNKNNENINEQKFDKLCKYSWFNGIINKTFLDFFDIYYNEGKPLKGVLIGDKIINLKSTKNFYYLLKNTEEHKEKILEIVKTVYLGSFRRKDKMFMINKEDSLNE